MSKPVLRLSVPTLVLATLARLPAAHADGLVMDKVYHPYVDPLERAVELRSIFPDTQPTITNKAQLHQLSLGRSFGQRTFAEIYLVGGKDRARGYENEAWEVEVTRQLTEQGEYWADYGMKVSYEEDTQIDRQGLSLGFMAEKELGPFSATGNLFLLRDWGDDVRKQFDTRLALQLRYRWRPELEPSLEVYSGQEARGIGPVLQGNISMGVRKTLHWESGLLIGVEQKSPNRTWRLLLEYEF